MDETYAATKRTAVHAQRHSGDCTDQGEEGGTLNMASYAAGRLLVRKRHHSGNINRRRGRRPRPRGWRVGGRRGRG